MNAAGDVGITVGDIKKAIEGVPDELRFNLSVGKSGQLDEMLDGNYLLVILTGKFSHWGGRLLTADAEAFLLCGICDDDPCTCDKEPS